MLRIYLVLGVVFSITHSQVFSEEVAKSSPGIREQEINPAEHGELPPEEYGNQFLRFSIRYTGGIYQDEEFRYQLLPARPIVPGKTYPVIIWLHGHGIVESTEDNLGQLNWTGLVQMSRNPEDPHDQIYKEKDRDFFMLVPHCPLGHQWFNNPKFSATTANEDPEQTEHDVLAVVAKILDETLQNHPIDPSRVSIVSVSAGGTAAWELAMRYPKKFAAVAPMASFGADLTRVHRLVDTPIWTFHNKEDPKSPIQKVEAVVNKIRRLGGPARLTAFDGTIHNSWSRAFYEYNLTNWLISQRQGQSRWKTEFSFFICSPGWWKPVAFWSGLVVVFAFVRRSVRQQRQKVVSTSPD